MYTSQIKGDLGTTTNQDTTLAPAPLVPDERLSERKQALLTRMEEALVAQTGLCMLDTKFTVDTFRNTKLLSQWKSSIGDHVQHVVCHVLHAAKSARQTLTFEQG